MQSLAVSSDAFFYKLGEDFYLTPGTQLQDHVRLFGFGADTGIDLPFEFDGRVPTNEIKAQLIESGALAEDEAADMQPGDVLLLAIGQGLLAATPMQLAVGYSTFANGGNVAAAPRRAGDPRARDAGRRPGFVDLTQAVVAVAIAPVSRPIPMPPEIHDPIQDGIRRNVTGAGLQRPQHDRRGAVPRLPGRRHPGRRQDRHRAGPPQLPVERLVGLRRLQHPARAPLHRRVLPREGGLRLDRRGAGRQVHVPRPVGQDRCSTRSRSPSRSTRRESSPAPALRDVDTACMARSDVPVRPPD